MSKPQRLAEAFRKLSPQDKHLHVQRQSYLGLQGLATVILTGNMAEVWAALRLEAEIHLIPEEGNLHTQMYFAHRERYEASRRKKDGGI